MYNDAKKEVLLLSEIDYYPNGVLWQKCAVDIQLKYEINQRKRRYAKSPEVLWGLITNIGFIL